MELEHDVGRITDPATNPELSFDCALILNILIVHMSGAKMHALQSRTNVYREDEMTSSDDGRV